MNCVTLVLFLGLTGPILTNGLKNVCSTGEKQSPIDLTGHIPFFHSSQLKYINFDILPQSATIWNDNTTLGIAYEWPKSQRPKIISPDGNQNFTFDYMQFHWGQVNDLGSEHRIDGKNFPIELHMLSYDETKKDLADALKDPDGGKVLVTATFGRIVHLKTHKIPIGKYINDITPAHTKVKMESIDLFPLDWFLPKNKKNSYFYHYPGSLTVPPCTEGVHWIVMEDHWYLSDHDIKSFRAMLTEQNINIENHRDPQPLNRRVIHKHKY